MSETPPPPRMDALAGSLINCLIQLTYYFHRPFSRNALISGLPLKQEGELTPEFFERAAKRADLESKITPLSLEEIKPNLLPAVLLLKNNRGLLVVSLTADQFAEVFNFNTKKTELIALTDLKTEFGGQVILVKNIPDIKRKVSDLIDEVKGDKRNWFWSELRVYWPMYNEVLLASAFINLLTLASPLFVMNVYDRVVPNNATATLWVLALGVLIAFSFDFILRMLRTHFLDNSARNIDTRLSSKVFEHLIGMQMVARPTSIGSIANTMQAFEAFRDFITSATITVLIDFPFVLIFVLFIWFIGGYLALVPLILIPIVLTVSLLIQAPLVKLVKKSYEVSGAKQTTMLESLFGIVTIKCNNAQSRIQRKWEEIIAYSAKLGVKIRFLSALAVNFSIFAQYLGSVMVVIAGVYRISNNEITVGALIACTILTGRALAPISQIASLLMRYYQSVAGIKGLSNLMELPTERPQDKRFLHQENFQGNFDFKNVSFTYPQHTVPALKDISFEIKQGEHIGIIGRIGSGKSTIIKLLANLYHATAGNILLDGIDMQQFDPADLRHHMAYVPQDIMLFSGTIRDNLTFGHPNATDEAILRAARFSGLDQLIANNPEGINLQVGERGEMLSGGQRQSVAISQAMLSNPSLLLLDEPTTSMDDISERLFKVNLAESIKNKTLVLVTHKGSMLSLVERIIILDNGKIVADGPRDQVIEALKNKQIKSKGN